MIECPNCGCRMRVESSRRVGNCQARYCRCLSCDHRRTVQVPISQIWGRKISTVEHEVIPATSSHK